MWRNAASKMPWCWFRLSSWEHAGIVFLCLFEGRCGHMTCSCQWNVSRQVCAIPQEKPQEPICNLPCFLLLISAPPAIADTYWTHSMSNQWAFVLLRGWHLGVVCCYSLTYRTLNDKESRCSWQRENKGEHGVRWERKVFRGQIVKEFCRPR